MPSHYSIVPDAAPQGPGPEVGAFEAGHLGELTRCVPFDLVDAVLVETGRVQQRLRLLPSRVGVYFVLALGLFPELGYLRVWGMLASALPGAVRVSEKALRDVRRVGAAPFKLLFETPRCRWRRRILPACDIGDGARWRRASRAGARTRIAVPGLVRMRSGRRLARLAVLPDGSILTRLGPLNVRVVQAQVTAHLADGTRISGHYALATSLPDHRAYPAGELIELYHERWEIETGYLALRHTLLHGRVLRSMDPSGLEQELWAPLALYQALRHAMVEAARTDLRMDPDRAGFTIALTTAQATLIQATGIAGQHHPAPPNAMTAAILAQPLPPRRPRICARKVKSPASRYPGRPLEERPPASTRITVIEVELEKPGTPPRPTPSPAAQARIMTPGSRVDRVFTLLRTEPERSFTPSELAQTLEIANINSFSVQLATWARRGLLGKTGRGQYTIPHNYPKRTP